jgi:glycosyltransferase 2 family protein
MAAAVETVRVPGPPPSGLPAVRRLVNFRMVGSLVVAAVLLTWIGTHAHLDYRGTLRTLARVNLPLFGLAIAVFYLSFAARTRRWQLLLGNAGEKARFRPLVHILLLTWFANCILPAKGGDLYRAYLLRRNAGISGSKALGTVLGERVLDFLVLMTLLMLSVVALFRAAMPARFESGLVTGLIIAVSLLGMLLGVQRQHHRLMRWIPERFRERAGQFRVGLVDALGRDRAMLIVLTLAVWAAESARLYLVTLALPLPVHLGPAHIIFIALVASLLTTIPALPGGLVLVEGGMIAVLSVFGLSPSVALSVAILDRLISYWAPVAVGAMLLVFAGQGRVNRAGGNITDSTTKPLQSRSPLLPKGGVAATRIP